MSAEDDGADLEQLFSRWKHVSDKSSQYASLANVVLARILGTVRAKTKWGAEKLQENLVRFGAERSLGFSHLMDCLGEKAAHQIVVDVSSIPKGRISRLLTVDSKIALGAFKGGEPLSLCYDRILNIPTEKFPTSLLDVTFALDEAVSLMPGLSTGESSSLDDNFATRVALSFDVAAARRDKNRQETAKNKVQHIAMAQERRRQQTEEIRSHKTAVRIAAVQEKERQKEREAELDRCRSEAYIAEQRKSDALRNHERSLAQAAVHGKNDARFERLLKSVRHSEKLAQEAEKQGRRKKVCPRVSTRRSKSVHVDAAARGRCAKNAKRSREERTRLVTKAYDALRVAEKSIHDAIGVPYSDENAYRKVLKTRDFVLGAMSQLSGLIEPGLTET